MSRLFVAADLPKLAIAELVKIQPSAGNGIRLTPQNQMHLTLHFLGKADIDQVRMALQPVAVSTFSITLAGVGEFRSTGGGMIAWVGVHRCEELLRLHAAIGDALTAIGFQPEPRPYTPHITLARCKTRHASAEATLFLSCHKNFRLPDQPITTFGIYSSFVVDQVRMHRCLQSFPLIDHNPSRRM